MVEGQHELELGMNNCAFECSLSIYFIFQYIIESIDIVAVPYDARTGLDMTGYL